MNNGNSATSSVLLLGGSSYVGRHLMAANPPFALSATYNKASFPGGTPFDVTRQSISSIFPHLRDYDAAVILLGDTDPETCIADPAGSQLLNVDSIKRLCDELNDDGVRIAFTSTEFVFSGEKGRYTEDDAAEPILLYGRQKIEVENYLRSIADGAVVLRLAKVVGDQPGDGTLFSNWLEQLQKPTTIRCATDQVFSPVYVGDVVAAIITAAQGRLTGLYHVAGPEPGSRRELLSTLVDVCADRIDIRAEIVDASIRDFALAEPRPLDVSMSPEKLVSATSLKLSSPSDICSRLVEAVLNSTADVDASAIVRMATKV